jgi:hypothetical protein
VINHPRYNSPLTGAECQELERLIARGVEGANASDAKTIPGWVYAGSSAEFDITLVVVAVQSDTPLATTFAQSVLSRVCELAELLFGARTTETRAPHVRPR